MLSEVNDNKKPETSLTPAASGPVTQQECGRPGAYHASERSRDQNSHATNRTPESRAKRNVECCRGLWKGLGSEASRSRTGWAQGEVESLGHAGQGQISLRAYSCLSRRRWRDGDRRPLSTPLDFAA